MFLRTWLICRLFSAAPCLSLCGVQGCSEGQEDVPSPAADTVEMIPGSQLLWRIAPRPANSTQVWLTKVHYELSLKRSLKIRICCNGVTHRMSIFFNCRCTASHALQCNSTSCVRRWREPFLRPTAGWGRTYEPWRTVTSVIVVGSALQLKIKESSHCSLKLYDVIVQIDLASEEKKRVEEKQRAARKNRSKSDDDWKTRWGC